MKLSILALVCCLAATQVRADSVPDGFQQHESEPQGQLRVGDPLVRQIKGGKRQSFTIPLTVGQLAEISVEQRGAVLMATLFDSQKREVIQMDYPGGGYGPIYLSAIAANSGDYELEIFSVNKWANLANYEVSYSSRNPTSADESLFKAQLAFSQAGKYLTNSKFPEAIGAYKESLAYWQSSQDYHWQAVTQFALSQAYGSRDRVKSDECLNETLRILNIKMAPNDWRLKASALNDLGTRLASLGQKDKGFATLDAALELYKANADRRGQASVFGNRGNIHYNQGNYFLARELAEKALELRLAENDKPGASTMLGALAAIADRLGEPEQALSYSKQALSELEGMEDLGPTFRVRTANILNSLAVVSDKLGRWDQAFEFYEKALAKYDEGDSGRAVPLDNKGELYAALGNSAKARECYQEALRLLEAAGKPNPDVKASVLVHMGQLSLAEGDLTGALKYFEDAKALQPRDPRLSDVLTNLGSALALKGNLDKALESYQQALDIQIKLKEKRGQALALQKRGEARARMHKQDDALADFTQALALWKTVKDRRGEAATLNNMARVERDRGNLAAALAHSQDAIQTIESLRTNISSRQLRASYFAAQENYYELDVDLKMQLSKTEKRAEYLAAALESAEKSRARVLLDALNEAGLGRGQFNQNSDPAIAKLLQQRSSLQDQLAAKAQARTRSLNGVHTPEQIAGFDREITQLNDAYEALETQIRNKNPRFATLTRPQPSKVKEIQAQLDEQTILVEYFLGEVRSYVWIVTRDSVEGFELAPRAQVEPLAHRVYEALSARGKNAKNEDWGKKNERITRAESDFGGASALLSEMVLGPISSSLGEKRLLIVADGALQTLPFGVLPAPKATAVSTLAKLGSAVQHPLIARHEIVSVPSASVLVLQRRELAGRTPAPYAIAVLADPVFDEGDSRVLASAANKKKNRAKDQIGPITNSYSQSASRATQSKASSQTRALGDIGLSDPGAIRRLVFSRDEARAIFNLVPANQTLKALDFKASRTTLLNPELSRYRIIHLATHGIMNLSHPELSGIVFSMVNENGRPENGYVGLNEIYGLNLPADLVVLSACETGIGKQIRGEGLIALTRGFMHAGAERVVASLWKVDDRATSELMSEFYKEMLVNKRKPAAALRAAQLKLYDRNPMRKPHFWAGFVLQGEWQ